MGFIINIDAINMWRAKQRLLFESDPLPVVSDFKSGRTIGERMINIFGGVMSIVSPIVLFIGVFIPILARFNPSTGIRLFLYLVVISLTGVIWKVGFYWLKKGFGKPTKEEFLFRAGQYFLKKEQMQNVARYYLELLTTPWKECDEPKGLLMYMFWNNQVDSKTKVTDNYLDILADLLFVELWLELSLNSNNNQDSNKYTSFLIKLSSNSKRLVEFASLLYEMGNNQISEGEKSQPVLPKLAEIFKENAPLAYAKLKGQ